MGPDIIDAIPALVGDVSFEPATTALALGAHRLGLANQNPLEVLAPMVGGAELMVMANSAPPRPASVPEIIKATMVMRSTASPACQAVSRLPPIM